MGKKDKVKAETEDVEEMREIDPEDDAVSYSDSGHASDAASHKSYAVSTRGEINSTYSSRQVIHNVRYMHVPFN